MRRCPQCRRDYYDETLLYCLDDGSSLLDGPASGDEPATAIHSSTAAAESPTRRFDPRVGRGNASPRNSLIAGVLGIILVTVLGVGSYLYYGRANSRAIDSIAVMPFTNESGNPEVEYLADGIPESLISSLSSLPNLTVKPRSSVFKYKGKMPEPKVLGEELNVQSVLIGTVVQRGSDLTLNVELVDASTERVLWSEVYKRPLANLVSLQTEIARKVSAELRSRLSGQEETQLAKSYTSNSEAYQLYLKGRYHFGKRTRDELYKAIEHFRQAVALDPNYALAYSGLADVYLILGGYDHSRPRLELAAEGRAYAQRALALDDNLSQAHNSMGVVLHVIDHDFAGAEAAFRQAIKLDLNNATAMGNLGYLLTSVGRFDEAEENYRRAVEIEPASANLNRSLGAFLMFARRYDESVAHLKKTIDLEPNFILGHLTLANTFLVQHRYGEAVESYTEARRLIGYDPAVVTTMQESYAKGGWREFVLSLDKGTWPELYRPSYIRACHYASIGEIDQAFAQLEKAYGERDGFIPLMKIDPRLDSLRDDPRYAALVKKVGL